jgi:hypothetical protein
LIHPVSGKEFCLLGYEGVSEYSASIFRALPKRRFILKGLRGVISQKIELFLTTAVKT